MQINIFRVIFLAIAFSCFLIVGTWGIIKISNPISPLPDINYAGKSRESVLSILLKENVKDPLSGKILIKIPFGRTVEIEQITSSYETKKYVFSKSEWDVNYMYAKNEIKGGYYSYRLLFDNRGIVNKQQVIFQSDIGLFGL